MVHNFNLGSLARRNARLFPSRKALVMGDDYVTFLEFNKRVNKLANALTGLGIIKGKRILTLLPNSFALAEVYFAAAKLGAIVIPVNLRILPQDVTYILSDSGSSLAVVMSDTFALLEPAAMELLENIVSIDKIEAPSLDYESILAAADDREPAASESVSPQDILTFCYTSGTTGKPKGCMMSQSAFLGSNQNIVMSYGVKETDAWLNVIPFYHMGDLGFFFAFFHMGAANVVLKKAEIEEILINIEENRCTGTLLVPPLLTAVVEYQRKKAYDVSSLKFVVGAGGGLESTATVEGVRDVLNCEFIGIYAQTESGDVISSINTRQQLQRPGSCGRPLPNFEYRIVDDDDNDVSVGSEGELILRGPSIMTGYWNNPEATEETLKNGWHHTGDVCKEDEESYLYMVDRKKYMIKTGALNVYPKEVELCLREHPAIKESAIVGVPDSKWGEAIKAFVVLNPGHNLSPKEVSEWCRGKIANYKRPRWVEFVEAIPYSFTGKLMKNELAGRPLSPEQSTTE